MYAIMQDHRSRFKKPYYFVFIMKKKSGTPFGANLRRLRVEKGLTQAQLAEQVGLSRRMIVHYEKYATHPPTEKVALLARALGVSAEDLLRTDSPNKSYSSADIRFARKLEKAKRLPPGDRKVIEAMITPFLKRAVKNR